MGQGSEHRPGGRLLAFFPFLEWLRGLTPLRLRRDAMAGFTVALVLIPQSMAYAQLAGLPPHYGLYAAFLPPMVAALFGSSPQLSTGPVAVVSLMSAACLEPLATAGSSGYIAYAVVLSLLVGAVQFGLGALRLGLLVNFLSHPVINGFSNAAALIIGASQLPKLFGVSVDSAAHEYETFMRVLEAAWAYSHLSTFLMGNAAFVLMILLKRLAPRAPGVLIVVVLATCLSWAVGFEKKETVALSRIADPEVRRAVTRFNESVAAAEALLRKRIEAVDSLEAVRQCGDPLSTMEAAFSVEVIGHELALEKAVTEGLRKRLREVLLEKVTDPGSDYPVFKRVVAKPPGTLTAGPVWRFKVGASPIDPERMVLSGGGDVVGAIAPGLPAMAIPAIDTGALAYLFPYALIIAILGFMEAVSIAKAMAAKTGRRLDPNQELVGQGLGNLASALSGSYPVSGSFSRSAVNLEAGAVSGISSLVTGLAVMGVLLFLTPLFYHLPQSVLGAVIMMAVVGLVNVKGFFLSWRAQWYDGAISVVTFFSTLFFAPHLDKGILLGVALSLGVFLYKSMRPTVVDLSLGVDRALHDAVAYGLKECRYIDVVRFDGPLFFASASYLEDQISDRRMANPELRHIIIVANGINDLDASGQESLSLTVDRVRSAGIDVSLSGVNEAVLAVLKRTHLLSRIGEDHLYGNIREAIRDIHPQTHGEGAEKNCPLAPIARSAQGPLHAGGG